MSTSRSNAWLNRNILFISLSAFFADSGYQIVIAGLPIFLVLSLKAPAYIFGIAMGLAYGIGAIFAYAGGRLADRYGRKKMAILGNSLIPILSFTGFFSNPVSAMAVFNAGWWARNFRTPARRAMQSDASSKKNRAKAFGFLNALDIGGGMTASALLIIFLYMRMQFSVIFLFSIIPLAASTFCLALVNVRKRANAAVRGKKDSVIKEKKNLDIFYGVLIATALYGFTSYSLGFPIITIAERSSSILGVLGYAIMMAVSAFSGFYLAKRRLSKVKSLAILGYMAAGMGSLMFGLSYLLGYGVYAFYVAAFVIGISIGSIETFEPTIVSLISSVKRQGSGMGMLSTSRSIGLFAGNIIMGLLYTVSPFYSYAYATAVAFAAGIILLASSRKASI
ncbi:MFS transporter [Candidatus Marsarchaeota archaeon]|jgi:MFS family permease|nr:MFS transporter [Candidatus Marsarchaeota archaeon]MCL5092549.1 MFS transporter [Candidatus Marsarchaeota archaeon]